MDNAEPPESQQGNLFDAYREILSAGNLVAIEIERQIYVAPTGEAARNRALEPSSHCSEARLEHEGQTILLSRWSAASLRAMRLWHHGGSPTREPSG